MRILKIIGGLVSFALAVMCCFPLVVEVCGVVFNMYQSGWRRHWILIPSISIADHPFFGWQVFLVLVPLALVGIAFGLVGYYAFKTTKSAA